MIRGLAIALLDDDHGISMKAWEILIQMLSLSQNHQDIINAVEIQDDRVYLSKDHNLS